MTGLAVRRRDLTAPPAPDPELDAIAARIRGYMKNNVKNVLEIGRNLHEAKARIAYGGFLPWLQTEFDWHERTAQRYMLAWERYSRDNIADVSTLRLGDLYGWPQSRARPKVQIIPPGENPDPPPARPTKASVVAGYEARIAALEELVRDARLVAAMLGDGWSVFVNTAREWDQQRRKGTFRISVEESGLDDVSKRRLLALDDELLGLLEQNWLLPGATSISVHNRLQGKPISFDAVRSAGKVLELLRRLRP